MKKELIKVHGGLDLPIAGEPSQIISNTFQPRKVALIGSDYIGLKPTMLIKEGDSVRKGDLLFVDKKNELAKYVSPVSGTIAEINRGERRVLQSVSRRGNSVEGVRRFISAPASERRYETFHFKRKGLDDERNAVPC